MRVTRRELLGNLRRDGEERLLIQIGAAEGQHQVRRARPQRAQHHPRLAAKLPVDGGGDASVGLVTHEDEFDAGAAQLVDEHEHLAAWQAEHAIDAGAGKKAREDGGGCGHRASLADPTVIKICRTPFPLLSIHVPPFD